MIAATATAVPSDTVVERGRNPAKTVGALRVDGVYFSLLFSTFGYGRGRLQRRARRPRKT